MNKSDKIIAYCQSVIRNANILMLVILLLMVIPSFALALMQDFGFGTGRIAAALLFTSVSVCGLFYGSRHVCTRILKMCNEA